MFVPNLKFDLQGAVFFWNVWWRNCVSSPKTSTW